jgi:hypothetical protein
VFLSATTSNQAQARVTSAATLAFTPGNWATDQSVVVAGVDDETRLGDTSYSLELGLIATDDPYYSRFAFTSSDKTVSVAIAQRDLFYARVRVALQQNARTISEARLFSRAKNAIFRCGSNVARNATRS